MKGFYLKSAADECYWVLKKYKCCVTLVKNTCKKYVSNMAFKMMRIFEMSAFKTKKLRDNTTANLRGIGKQTAKRLIFFCMSTSICV